MKIYRRKIKSLPDSFKAKNKKRLSPSARGYGRDWQKLRNCFIKKNPLCKKCLSSGLTVSADCVDHIIPHTGINCPLRLDIENLQSLCNSCHSQKTAKEDGAFGNIKR